MTKVHSLKSLKNSLNDFSERFSSKKAAFVQAERPSERCPKIDLNSLKTLPFRLNGWPVERPPF